MAVDVEQRGRVLVGTLRDPANRNAVTAECKAELELLLDRFGSECEVRCLLLIGSDGCFSAGGDIKSFREVPEPHLHRDRLLASHRILQKFRLVEKPVVSAVNGPAVGAGFGLALMGDLVIASRTAFFQAAFSAVGLAPDWGLGATLREIVGPKVAADVLLTNRRIKAEEALSLGLVSRVIEPDALAAEALALATQIAAGAPLALGLTKRLLQHAADCGFSDYLSMEGAYQALALASADHRAAVEAFLAKRK